MAVVRTVAVTVISFLMIGCATAPTSLPAIPVFDGPEVVIEDVEPLTLPDPVPRFDHDRLLRRSDDDTLKALNRWVFDSQTLSFRYDPRITATATDGLRGARGNCVTFSHLFIALARQLGLDAVYQQAWTLPDWDARAGMIISNQHLNVRIYVGMESYTADVATELSRQITRLRPVSDARGMAHHYANLGSEALFQGDIPRAYAAFAKALEHDPTTPFAWSNLGVALNRNGQPTSAEIAYRTAMSLERNHYPAMGNLAGLLRTQGRIEEAADLESRIASRQKKNPYYWWILAKRSGADGQHDQALSHLQRAIRLEPNDHRFYLEMALHHQALGNIRVAENHYYRARNLLIDQQDPYRLPESLSDYTKRQRR